MNRRRGAGALAIAGVLALPAGAAAAAPEVSVQFAAFAPSQVDALPGETVTWANVSPRGHTVTSDSGVFGSELASGMRFAWTFAAVGAYPYHCTIHPSMTGEIDVRRVTLGPLPVAALRPGTPVEFTGRTADPSSPVRIEHSRDGTHFATVATAAPDAAGDWSTSVRARATGDYRAASGAGVSELRRLLVSGRRVKVRAGRRGIAVTVTPSDPYGRVVLQVRRRERFGWWPVTRTRLDYVSEARFAIRRPVRARVVLVAADGWTPLATSRVLVLRR
jgi:plastocyanin